MNNWSPLQGEKADVLRKDSHCGDVSPCTRRRKTRYQRLFVEGSNDDRSDTPTSFDLRTTDTPISSHKWVVVSQPTIPFCKKRKGSYGTSKRFFLSWRVLLVVLLSTVQTKVCLPLSFRFFRFVRDSWKCVTSLWSVVSCLSFGADDLPWTQWPDKEVVSIYYQKKGSTWKKRKKGKRRRCPCRGVLVDVLFLRRAGVRVPLLNSNDLIPVVHSESEVLTRGWWWLFRRGLCLLLCLEFMTIEKLWK